MSFIPKTWVDDQIVYAEDMNRIEQGIADAVSVTSQSLNDAQKTQARANIAAAPGGFGLGGVAKILTEADNVDNIKVSGWYTWSWSPNEQPAGLPSESEYHNGLMRVDTGNAISDVAQTIYFPKVSGTVNAGDQCVIQRMGILDGTWNAWEWVNPPMQLGVEYRTVERYLGKPVYVKLVDFGALPNATTKIVEYGDSVCRPIFGYGISTEGNTFPSLNFGGALADSFNSINIVSLWLNGNVVLISCGGDRSTINAYVFVKYWKTTD